jgi:hypothetical protein
MKKVFIAQRTEAKPYVEIVAEREAVTERVKAIFEEKGEDVEVIQLIINSEDKPLKRLAKHLSLLAEADRAVFCDGWERSKECRIAHLCCEEYDIKTLHA